MSELIYSSCKLNIICSLACMFVCRVGELVKPMAKAKLSTHKGVVQDIFSGCHVTIFATAKSEISASIIRDKVNVNIIVLILCLL